MVHWWRIAPIATAALIVVAGATQAAADGRRGSHAPIYVKGPTARSVVTPYYFGYYGSHYSYNSPGPVFNRLAYWGPANSCRLWRYNYLYWIC